MRKLTVGERVENIPIYADKPWNSSGFLVGAGEKYRIDASAEIWFDASIASTAAGQPGRGIQMLFKALIRCRHAQWFQLVAVIGDADKPMFPVGLGADIVVSQNANGELGFFANDVSFMYWNNSGAVHIVIERKQ